MEKETRYTISAESNKFLKVGIALTHAKKESEQIELNWLIEDQAFNYQNGSLCLMEMKRTTSTSHAAPDLAAMSPSLAELRYPRGC